VPFAIARSGVASVVLYALPVIGILVVLPASAITKLQRGSPVPSRRSSPCTAGHVAANAQPP